MDTISPQQLHALSEQRNRICVSIFLPTHPAGRETQQDPIRLKNLLREAESKMAAEHLRRPAVGAILGPARQLADRSGFWRAQSSGLVIYLSEGFFQYFRLPMEFGERALVSDRFEITPLLPLFASGGRYYLLALSQKRARLFEGTPAGLGELDSGKLPHGISEALKYDVHERQQQFHGGPHLPGTRNKEGAVFHGQAVGVDDAKERLLLYFQQINRALRDVLRDPWAPLVLAGVEKLFPIYRQANTYGRLVDEGVKGNPDYSSLDELHKAADRVLQPHFQKARDEAVARFTSLVGTGKASGDLTEVLRAAFAGRVDYALIQPNAESWGRFDPDRNQLELHANPEPGDEDLVNAVAAQTILHRGAVYTVPQMPSSSPAAAVFRYPL